MGTVSGVDFPIAYSIAIECWHSKKFIPLVTSGKKSGLFSHPTSVHVTASPSVPGTSTTHASRLVNATLLSTVP
jgi:hypothetical protein